MGAEPIPHDLLLAHAGFLRRLARDLVGDPSAADDAVQEVWLRALERPPNHGSNVRGWLRVVLTNLVRTRARDDSRRTARELDHGTGRESAPSAEQQSALRSVTEAVLALEEPLRTTVLQHYFQGLTTAEIATRDNLPVSTVKSRIQRALAILRERMTREGGDSWRFSLFALTVPAKLGKGVLVMTLKTKLALACAVGLLAWAWLHDWGTPTTAPIQAQPLELASKLESEPPADRSTVSSTGIRASGRELAQGSDLEVQDPDASAADQETRVYGNVFGARPSGTENPPPDWVLFTDATGQRYQAQVQHATYSVHKLPFGKYWIHARANGWRTLELPFELEPEHPHVRRDLQLRPAPVLSVFVRAPDGHNLEPVVMEHLSRPDPGLGLTTIPKLIPVATREPPGAWIPEVIGSANNPFGVGQFLQYTELAERRKEGSIGVLVVDDDLPVYASLVDGHAVLCTERVDPGADEVVFVIAPDAREANFATLTMRVLDADTREPLPQARLSLSGGPHSGGGKADSSGVIASPGCEPGLLHMFLQAEGHETLMRSVALAPGKSTDLGEILLAKGLDVQFRVLDADGEPHRGYFAFGVVDPATLAVEVDDSRSWESDERGILELSSLGRRLYVLRTTNHDAIHDQAPDSRKSVSGNLLIDLRAGVLPAICDIHLQRASRLLLAAESPLFGGPRFRVLDGQGTELVSDTLFGSAPRGLSLPPGSYRVELFGRDGTLLSTKSVMLGSTPQTLELSR